jgi:aryl sulfotransferase
MTSVHNQATAWSLPARTMRNHSLDSTRWARYAFREDDIVIATWAKTGTTWLQQILGQLIFNAAEGLPVFEISPWIEWRVYPLDEMLALLESQRHRRFVKTHLPIDALLFSPTAKYLYIGRDGRDVVRSWHHHHLNLTQLAYDSIREVPGLEGPMLEPPTRDFRRFFHTWLQRDGDPLWPFWSHVQSWWDVRHFPNVMLVHFLELKRDMAGAIRRIAQFLDIPIDESRWPLVLEHCTFDYMKRNADKLSPVLETAFVGGAQTFVNRGISGGWRGVLTDEDSRAYEVYASRNLAPDTARWLATGQL